MRLYPVYELLNQTDLRLIGHWPRLAIMYIETSHYTLVEMPNGQLLSTAELR